ncbi:monooxygenase 1-like isoform X2 [Syzygium oleosum]|uniref:monooxygenase 1-like isoform X2 n=1 Tax=Syzygium oleosum TaxID=219896 RepID=UPI0024BBD9BB|nr:monooxygenase 1-like isoform X2 [Syzygium oleosum]
MAAAEAEHRDIVIVGGGICGLATALALHRKGISSLVLERSDALRATGTAIGIQTNGWRALDQLRVGSKLRQTSLPLKGLGEARCLRRSVLLEALAGDLPSGTIRFGSRVLAIETDPQTSYPILWLHDGSVIKAKVVIGCDGVNSEVANFLDLRPPRMSPTCNVRGFTIYPDGHGYPHDFVTINHNRVFLGRIPLDDKSVYWFIARPWTHQDSTISKNSDLIKRSTVESMLGFPAEILEMIENSKPDSLSLTRTSYRAPWDVLFGSFRKGTATVAGDAMHVMGPFLGQGGSAALEDAIVLARCLVPSMTSLGHGELSRERIGGALDSYISERRMRLVRLSAKTYTIGSLLESTSLVAKLICILVIILFFRDRLGHTQYDCGRL